MAREKMVFGWEKVLVCGEPMVELVSVSGVAYYNDLPREYIYGQEYIDSATNVAGFYASGDVVGLRLGRTYVVGDRLSCAQYLKMKQFLQRCAVHLRHIDNDIMTRKKENVDWHGAIVDEI